MKIHYVNYQHEMILRPYLDFVKNSIKAVVHEESKLIDYMSIYNAIIEYSNNYDCITNDGNFYDYLNIIPLQISTMTSGFFCGYENKSNQHEVTVYRELLGQYAARVIGELKEIKISHE
ncbi:MAG: hypothetical protein GOVbin2669_26 [Prokaryotic dsDNA virus sp.]|nr:MAG: hypothetical protein GOVbin2669_26 [Prokaryotic dsDNA virus sp.]|tara:strand:+ start:3910 stop:4266 length:357 start_codon:yes stop_codon:yes gene_type:complete